LKVITRDSINYAVIGSIGESRPGWSFYKDLNSPLQWGIGLFDTGEELRPHFHKVRTRVRAHKTYEFIYVVIGSIWTDFYEDRKLFCSEKLLTGDFVYFIDGTHGIRILEDSTRLIEVKNGPFSGKDKERI
jgi:hypothetical protein